MPRGVPKKRCMTEFKKHAVETIKEEKLSYSKPILFDYSSASFAFVISTIVGTVLVDLSNLYSQK